MVWPILYFTKWLLRQADSIKKARDKRNGYDVTKNCTQSTLCVKQYETQFDLFQNKKVTFQDLSDHHIGLMIWGPNTHQTKCSVIFSHFRRTNTNPNTTTHGGKSFLEIFFFWRHAAVSSQELLAEEEGKGEKHLLKHQDWRWLRVNI